MENDTDGPRNDPSCLACKRLKRKCSRDHPTCSLCRKTKRRCQYPGRQSADDGLTSISMLRNRICELEDELSKTRMSQALEYSVSPLKSGIGSSELPPQSTESTETFVEHSTRSEFALLFLDSVAYRNREHRLWQTIEANLSKRTESSFSETELRQIIDDHIHTTHKWFPIRKPGLWSRVE